MGRRVVPLAIAFAAGAALSLAVVHAAGVKDEDALRAEVEGALLDVNRLMDAGDVEGWAAMFLEPLVMVFSDPLTHQGVSMQFQDRSLRRFIFDNMKATMPKRFAQGDYTGLTKDVRFLSPTVCVVYATFEPQSAEEELVPREGYTVLVKQGSKWRICALVGGEAPSTGAAQ